MLTYPTPLEEAYLKLTFKHEGTPAGTARAEAFTLLLRQHLISKDILDLQAWKKSSQKGSCLADFTSLYGKQLWPGSVAARQHLANPALRGGRNGQTKYDRSFVASFDGRRIEKALKKFIEVMLEESIEKEKYWGLPSVKELCAKATKVADGSREEGEGGRSPTMSEIERDLGIGGDIDPGPPGEEMEFGTFSDEDEDEEMLEPVG